jgi:hypothetical protein
MLLVLLMQTAPLMALQAPRAEERCPMGCCEWLAEEGLADCGCSAGPANDKDSLPAPLPPVSSSRELVPLVVWKELPALPQLPPVETGRTIRPACDEQTLTTPHVRLSVLFCSFLT